MSVGLMPAAGNYQKGRSLKQLITAAGLWPNCKLCLDPGDRQSWPGSGTTIFDVSGNGLHFTLGSASSPVAGAPTFSGTVGARSANEYFVNNGATSAFGLSLASGVNDTFLNNLHKTGWTFSTVELIYFTTATGPGLVTKTGAQNSSSAVGFAGYITASSPFNPSGVHGNGSGLAGNNSSLAASASTMTMVGIGRKYNSTTSRDSNYYVNGSFQQTNSSASFTPSASAASSKALIGLTSDLSTGWGIGRRMYGFAMFDHMLAQSEYDALRAQLLKRWSGI